MKLFDVVIRSIIIGVFFVTSLFYCSVRSESGENYILSTMGTTSVKKYTESKVVSSLQTAEYTNNNFENNGPIINSAVPNLTVLNNEDTVRQWALNNLDGFDLWELSHEKNEVIVAVLDTGIDCNHEDLKGKVIASVNFTDSDTVLDINGHGTHVAGIIAAYADNMTGIAGIAPDCFLLNVKVADDQGFVFTKSVAEGIMWAVDNGANIINISLAFHQSSTELYQAINYAWAKGVLVVAAAGNTEQGTIIYPAYYDNVIAVTSIGESGSLAPLSNYAEWVDVAAPGVNIYSCLPENSYGYKSGTSFATGHVSGIAALFYSTIMDVNNNGFVNDEVRESIEQLCQLPSLTH